MSVRVTLSESTDARNARLAKEVRMYGASQKDVIESIEDSITFKFSGPAMVVASLMSDAQEEIIHGMPENARQTLNRAKLVVSMYLMKED